MYTNAIPNILFSYFQNLYNSSTTISTCFQTGLVKTEPSGVTGRQDRKGILRAIFATSSWPLRSWYELWDLPSKYGDKQVTCQYYIMYQVEMWSKRKWWVLLMVSCNWLAGTSNGQSFIKFISWYTNLTTLKSSI